MARVYTQFLPGFLAGKPQVVVRNMPAGGGVIGANYAYMAKPDGMTTLLSSGSTLTDQLLGLSAVRYDLLKMPLTAISATTGGFYYLTPGIIARPEDYPKAKGIIFGSTPGAATHIVAALEVLGIPLQKAILAYGGTGDSRRAFLSGEINMGYGGSTAYSEMEPFVKSGQAMPFFQTGVPDQAGGLTRDPGLPLDIPTVKELYERVHGKPPAGTAWDAFRKVLGARTWDKGLYLPPGTPDSVVQAYWTATSAIVKDPEALKVTERIIGAGVPWIGGKESEATLRRSFSVDPEVRDWLRSTLLKYGVTVD